MEEDISALNREKATLEASLADPLTYSDKQRFLGAEKAYKEAGEKLNRLNVEFEKLFERLMQLEADQ